MLSLSHLFLHLCGIATGPAHLDGLVVDRHAILRNEAARKRRGRRSLQKKPKLPGARASGESLDGLYLQMDPQPPPHSQNSKAPHCHQVRNHVPRSVLAREIPRTISFAARCVLHGQAEPSPKLASGFISSPRSSWSTAEYRRDKCRVRRLSDRWWKRFILPRKL